MNTQEAKALLSIAHDEYVALVKASPPSSMMDTVIAWHEYVNALARYDAAFAQDTHDAYDAWQTRSE